MRQEGVKEHMYVYNLVKQLEGLAGWLKVLLLAESGPHDGEERREAEMAIATNIVDRFLPKLGAR